MSKITLKQGENYLHTEESTKSVGASMSVGNNAVQLNSINLGLTDKDIEYFSYNKSQIVGNNVNISGVVDESGNNMRDYQFINSDFQGNLAIPIQLLTKEGRQDIVNSYKNLPQNTGKVFQETIGGVGMLGYGLANGTLLLYKDKAFDDESIDPYSHQKSKEATGNYIGSGLVSTLFSSAIEAGQHPYYSLTYLLGMKNKYDPLGVWSPNSSRPNPESIGGLTGQSYIQDMQNDVIDMYNGSQGNFNYITNIDEYNKSVNK